jgi:diacylglycerol kinase family enzyme
VTAFAGANDVVVRSLDGRPVPLQVDGDHVEDATRAEFSVVEGALRVIG